MRDGYVRLLSRLHTSLYRLTGGLVGRRLVANDILLLTTWGTGGKAHTVPLLYLTHGEALVVIASYGGRPKHPVWYSNLQKRPEARVQIGSGRMEVRARTATGEERARIWPAVVDAYDGYAGYQARTDREIPIVLLDRRNSSSGRR